MKNTVLSFQKAKKDGQKLTMLTAYDYSTAKLGKNGENTAFKHNYCWNSILCI